MFALYSIYDANNFSINIIFSEFVIHFSEICCFLSCNKPATLHCQDCSDVYCSDCSKNVHKSAKSLWSHKQSPLNVSTKGTLELEKCSEHNMDLEFYCTTCKTTACCYCLVEKHESHARENLVKLVSKIFINLVICR